MNINFTNKTFSFFLFLSLSFHLLVILFLIVSKGLPHLLKKDKNLLIQNAIRVDAIGLPDLPSKTKIKKEKRKTVIIQKPKPKKEKRKATPIQKLKKEKTKKKEKSKDSQTQNNREKKTKDLKKHQFQ